MTEELHYATVVFKNGGAIPRENEESTIYSSVKRKVPATTVVTAGGGAAGGGAAGGGAAEGGAAGGGAAEGGAAGKGAAAGGGACSQTFLLLVCLGITFVLLMICIGAIIYIFGVMENQKAAAENTVHLEKENQQLMIEKEMLQNKTEELTSVTEDLNRTLGVIMSFPEFPVNEFCPDKKCQPCRDGWIPFQDHCYLFYDKPPRWKRWDEANTHCRSYDADLAVVDSLREQEFINDHTRYYYDENHGYWLGLHQNADDHWVWINGRNETEGFWMETKDGSGLCALTIPGHNATASWKPAGCTMWNKFICEHDSLIRTPGS